ncbi:carbohydrate sulfotransferase 15 [Stegostoma tigrinum]|uniref:carbohydrate sulfotransferase 15 n=1 Tax=Stegostoma tigrinum TaxID=3053191 RepID=UPI00202AFB8D|nr:carbohydrate sulfotransferase 15 [Stegostoma tigrinum]XP_048407328.1 carbohydrate sulfotransferase 15 [Stegostoma tigrinum]XP_048407329.1 carbohydrate sulfotransferase 15 [Stegostoma tigrinum]XP_048407330.1 carbohydrate sulfotransferase 15 [Stegostoma tigrinum]XP_048407332.1 carbohydrate sulfotransferase 15 [Stegostoma tigrinum]XP_048407333.1 carbohydrate sulfotransferase 15 [Stegostoma tigrinum]
MPNCCIRLHHYNKIHDNKMRSVTDHTENKFATFTFSKDFEKPPRLFNEGEQQPMNLLATLEVKGERRFGWSRHIFAWKAKHGTLFMGVIILCLVMVSYILTRDQQKLLLTPSPFQYSTTTNNEESPELDLTEVESDAERLSLPFNWLERINHATHEHSTDSKLQLMPRRLPEREDLVKQEAHIFSVIPRNFLQSVKNHCWYTRYTGTASTDPYKKNAYFLHTKHFQTIFDYLKKVIWKHLQHRGDEHYRLRCLPYFYIIGQPKCGTTDLYNRLRLHPEVSFSIVKEPHWWTRKRFGIIQPWNGFHDRYLIEDYLDLFDLAAHQIQSQIANASAEQEIKSNTVIGEASASTMWDNNAWQNFYHRTADGEPPYLILDFLHAVLPSAKLIVMLRDPVERLYSDYLYFISANKSVEDFHEKVKDSLQIFDGCLMHSSLRSCVYNCTVNSAMPVRLQIGLYAVFLWDWFTVYNPNQFLILRLEEHAADLRKSMHRVFDFLNLGSLTDQQEAAVINNPASNTRRPKDKSLGPMLSKTRELLKDFYGPFNEKLALLLNDDSFLWEQ